MEYIKKKGFPHFIFQSNHPIQPTIDTGAEAAQSRPKEKRENTKRTDAGNGGSTKTKKPRDRCAHQRSPTKLLDFEVSVSINTKKGGDDDDVDAKGFPRYAARRKGG